MPSRKFDLAIFCVVAIAAVAVQIASMHLIVGPEHDELAYTYNSLYWSGRISNTTEIAWIERPPLFWWSLTFLMSLGASPVAILVVSPIFAVLLALLLTEFVKEVTNDRRAALVAGLITALSGFVGATGSRILTDVMGTFFATLCVYAFYKYFLDRGNNATGTRVHWAFLCGASLALSLIARDENLTLIPILALLWIFTVSKSPMARKIIYAIVFFAFFAGPIALLGLAGALQLASNILTPIVLGGWWAIILASLLLFYLAHKAHAPRFRDGFFAFFAFFALMMPFFYDNYVIANIDYYVTGKGVLSRPVSHVLMLPLTGGVGANLTLTERAASWLSTLPGLITPAVFLLATVGFYSYFKARKTNLFLFMFFWLGISLGYVVFGTNLEDRFLLIGFPPLCICAGSGIAYVWRWNRFVAILFSAATLFLVDINPNSPISPSNLVLVSGYAPKTTLWFYQYLASYSIGPTTGLRLPIGNLLDGIIGLALPLIAMSFILLIAVFPSMGSRFARKEVPATVAIPVVVPSPHETGSVSTGDESPAAISKEVPDSNSLNATPRSKSHGNPKPVFESSEARHVKYSDNLPKISHEAETASSRNTVAPVAASAAASSQSNPPAPGTVTQELQASASPKKDSIQNSRADSGASRTVVYDPFRPTIRRSNNSDAPSQPKSIVVATAAVSQPQSASVPTGVPTSQVASSRTRSATATPDNVGARPSPASSNETTSASGVLTPNSKFFQAQQQPRGTPNLCSKCGAVVRGNSCQVCGNPMS